MQEGIARWAGLGMTSTEFVVDLDSRNGQCSYAKEVVVEEVEDVVRSRLVVVVVEAAAGLADKSAVVVAVGDS